MKTATLRSKNSANRLSRQLALLFIPLALACFALSPQARATCQDACLTNNNTVQGDDALISNMTGGDNTAVGFQALYSNTFGSNNTATGFSALQNLGVTGTGNYNTATGSLAIAISGGGSYNTATGAQALYYGGVTDNTATGFSALFYNLGSYNTADGSASLYSNQFGNSNTAVGYLALSDNYGGSNNIALGALAGANIDGNNNIDIGHIGLPGDHSTIRIGDRRTHTKTFIAGISGAPLAAGVGVVVGTTGQLGTVVSSARYKDNIKPMDSASDAILALKPVTFRYKHDLDPEGVPQFGLVGRTCKR